MKFSKETTTAQPTPTHSKDRLQANRDGLITLDQVAQTLQVSRRYVQSLVRRKVIPVIRIGKRCTRFDLASVMAAVKKYEIEEFGRR